MSNVQSGRVSVWWDLNNCSVPQTVDASDVAKNVRAMLLNACLMGPATIDAFGDTKRLGQKVQEGLSSTGISLNHIPSGNKDAADKAILVAMLFWALDNAPPASLVLISGDGDFANALHRLRFKGYNVLLVQPDQPVKSALSGAASSVWDWTSVVNGPTHVDGFSDPAAQERCVSTDNMKYEFPKEIWMDLGHFLCKKKKRELIMKANTRLEAAQVLKCSGPARMQQLLIDQIMLLLNQSIQEKKWLHFCGKGWSSVVVNLEAVVTFVGTKADQTKAPKRVQTKVPKRVQTKVAGSKQRHQGGRASAECPNKGTKAADLMQNVQTEARRRRKKGSSNSRVAFAATLSKQLSV